MNVIQYFENHVAIATKTSEKAEFRADTRAWLQEIVPQAPVALASYRGVAAKSICPRTVARILDNEHRSTLLIWQMRQRTFETTRRRPIEEAEARTPAFTSSAVKLLGTRLMQQRAELHLAAPG